MKPTSHIRSYEPDDFDALFEIYSARQVIEQTSQVPHLSTSQVRALLETTDAGAASRQTLVLERALPNGKNQVVGHVTLFMSNKPREKHCASLAIAVHPAHQGHGFGKQLMQHALDQADNWLNIVRLELDVYSDNKNAIALYQTFGFETEGCRRMASFKNGKYADLHIMARLRST